MQTEDQWLPLFEWLEMTGPALMVSDSIWLFPVLEAIHLLGLCLLGGAVLVVDLRILGLTMKEQPIAELAIQMHRWLLLALAILLSTGVFLFLSEAVKCYFNQAFWVKMITLPIALAFTFFVRQRAAKKAALEAASSTKLVALASLVLWFTVAAAGRWIGFS
ncbi:MAG: DUF6644 family protein [Woeseiaceae bacterium]